MRSHPSVSISQEEAWVLSSVLQPKKGTSHLAKGWGAGPGFALNINVAMTTLYHEYHDLERTLIGLRWIKATLKKIKELEEASINNSSRTQCI